MEKVDWSKLETWAWSLGVATIGGGATALSAIQGSDWIGHPLDWHQIGAVALAGAFWSAVAFFKQSPLPVLTTSVSATSTTTTTTNKTN